jgi:hypothetical protein
MPTALTTDLERAVLTILGQAGCPVGLGTLEERLHGAGQPYTLGALITAVWRLVTGGRAELTADRRLTLPPARR